MQHGNGQILQQLIWYLIRSWGLTKLGIPKTLLEGSLVPDVVIKVDKFVCLASDVGL